MNPFLLLSSIALETLQVFSPLAKLLGMYQIKSELENLSFMYTSAHDYAEVNRIVTDLYKEHEKELQEAERILAYTRSLTSQDMECAVLADFTQKAQKAGKPPSPQQQPMMDNTTWVPPPKDSRTGYIAMGTVTRNQCSTLQPKT